MKGEVITVSPDDTLSTALVLTRKHRVRHLPVLLVNGVLTGIVSDRDIRLAMPSPLTTPDAERADYLERTAIGAVMTRRVISVGPDETVEDAARLLFQHRIGSLPVVGADGRLIGILTETDVVHTFVRLLGAAEPSSRVEVVLPDRVGELGRALTLIGEEAGTNIVSAVVPSFGRTEQKIAILRLATIDPRDAIAALEGAGYTVGWPSLERDVRGTGDSRIAG